MLLRSDVLALRSEMKCRLATFAWLLAAAMAALGAAPAAAHADTLDLSSMYMSVFASGNSYDAIPDYAYTTAYSPKQSVTSDFTATPSLTNASVSLNQFTNGHISGSIGNAHSSYKGWSTSTYDDVFYVDGHSSSAGYSYFYVLFIANQGWLPAGTPVRLIYDSFVSGSGAAGNTSYLALDNLMFYGANLNAPIPKTCEGVYYKPAEDVRYIMLRFTCNGPLKSEQRLYFRKPILLVDDGSTGQIVDAQQDTTGAIDKMHDDLMNTNGSGDIASGALGGAQSALDQHMSFMEQVDSLAGHFTSISADSDSSVTFPGIVIGEFKLPPAKVDIWEHMGALETPCKTICTGVFIFAWFNGMRALYGRIFHDEKDVILD